MQGAIIYSWTGTVPGREAASKKLMEDSIAFSEKSVANGRISDYAWYLSTQGGTSFCIVRGEMETLIGALADPELNLLNARSGLINQNFHWGIYATGDSIPMMFEMFLATSAQVA